MTADSPHAPLPGGPADDALRLLASVLAGASDSEQRIAYLRDLADGDVDDPAEQLLASWFRRALPD